MEVERHGGKRSIDHYVLGKTLGIGSFGESCSKVVCSKLVRSKSSPPLTIMFSVRPWALAPSVSQCVCVRAHVSVCAA
jgi:hypothetical protein